MPTYTAYVGLDVHKDSIDVAVAQGALPPEHLGTVPHEAGAVLRRLRRKLGDPLHALVCYEAGPTGFGLQQALGEHDVDCHVVAPSLVPRLPGDRVKTDRRDALKLARFLRAGELTAVYVPDEQTESIRDLERARADAKKAEKVARQTLSAFLLRRGRRYSGQTRWTKGHLDWIRKQRFEHQAAQRVLADYLHTVEKANERVEQLTNEIAELVEGWCLAPLVKALQALRGVRLVTAVTVAAELGDLRRFRSPKQLMAYLGLVPSEHTTGHNPRRFGITKTGNGHVRRVLVEAAWAYRFLPRRSPEIRAREQGVSEPVRDLAWKAQKRLCGKYRRLQGRGKSKQVTITAVARELAGFMWAIGQQDQLLAA